MLIHFTGMSWWIKAAKEGNFALPADDVPSFVPVVVEPVRASKTSCRERTAVIESVIGVIKVRVRNGADVRTVEAVLRAARRASP